MVFACSRLAAGSGYLLITAKQKCPFKPKCPAPLNLLCLFLTFDLFNRTRVCAPLIRARTFQVFVQTYPGLRPDPCPHFPCFLCNRTRVCALIRGFKILVRQGPCHTANHSPCHFFGVGACYPQSVPWVMPRVVAPNPGRC